MEEKMHRAEARQLFWFKHLPSRDHEIIPCLNNLMEEKMHRAEARQLFWFESFPYTSKNLINILKTD